MADIYTHTSCSSRNALAKLIYKDFRIEHPGMYAQHLVCAFEVAIIQQRHQDRCMRLQKKKAHDRRTSRNLCRKEGRREHNRVGYRLHQVADAVLDFAEAGHSAIIIEGLTGIRPRKRKNLRDHYNRSIRFLDERIPV